MHNPPEVAHSGSLPRLHPVLILLRRAAYFIFFSTVAIRFFRPYLFGQVFRVVTDHDPLKYLAEHKDQNDRLKRWSLKIQHIRASIEYRPGREHANADAMTRPPIVTVAVVESESSTEKSESILFDNEKLRAMQLADPDIAVYIHYLEKRTLPKSDEAARLVVLEGKHMEVLDGVLHHSWWPQNNKQDDRTRWQLVVPKALREEILESHHDEVLGGHLSVDRTYDRIRNSFWWPTIRKDVTHWVKSCTTCQERQTGREPKLGLMQAIVTERPWQRVGMDFLGPLPKTKNGNTNIIVFSDYFTKWVEAFPTTDQKANTVARLLLDEVICRHGAPEILLSDRGKQFIGKVVSRLNQYMNIRKHTTTSYHPQTDGVVERFNGTLLTMLSKFTSERQDDWDVHLPGVLFAYRTTPHATTKETPFSLLICVMRVFLLTFHSREFARLLLEFMVTSMRSSGRWVVHRSWLPKMLKWLHSGTRVRMMQSVSRQTSRLGSLYGFGNLWKMTRRGSVRKNWLASTKDLIVSWRRYLIWCSLFVISAIQLTHLLVMWQG
jgi:transposase InsO family protein